MAPTPNKVIATLAEQISAQRERLDQTFQENLRQLRRQHSDTAVDALALMHKREAERLAVAVSHRPKHEHPPRL